MHFNGPHDSTVLKARCPFQHWTRTPWDSARRAPKASRCPIVYATSCFVFYLTFGDYFAIVLYFCTEEYNCTCTPNSFRIEILYTGRWHAAGVRIHFIDSQLDSGAEVCSGELYASLESVWQPEPDARPSANELMEALYSELQLHYGMA